VSSHLDLDALADLLAGLEPPAHLAGCTGCQARLAELSTALGSVTQALRALPEPELPAGLTDRLLATLASTAAQASATPPVGAPVAAAPGTATVVPLAGRRTGTPRWMLAAGGVAAAAAVVVGVFVVVRPGSSGSKATSAPDAPAIARNDTGTAYTKDAASLTAVLPGLLAGKAVTPKGAAELAAPQAGSLPDSLAPLRVPATLAACLSSLTDPGDPGLPLALDYGTFDGQPALLVILPAPKPGYVYAYFVGPQCAPADSKLLFFEKIPKP
jgi:hypothetical protein